MDNQIDTTTGTVKLKAQFQNADYTLFPNQFVNILLLLKTLKNATVIPTAAIQNGIEKTFVYLVKKDLTVQVQPVTVGVTEDNMATITSGLSPGQVVVIEGADKLTEGTHVTFSTTKPLSNAGNPIGHNTS
jgi:membrane fusion protein, multidrug efflux system